MIPRWVLPGALAPATFVGGAISKAPLPGVLTGAALTTALSTALLLAPRWTSRESRAAALATQLTAAGLAPEQVTELVRVALTRRAGGEELPDQR